MLETFNKRREFIEKRINELLKFNILKQKVSGPSPNRMNMNSKEHYEIYRKFQQADRYTKMSIYNQFERKKIRNSFSPQPLEPSSPIIKISKVDSLPALTSKEYHSLNDSSLSQTDIDLNASLYSEIETMKVMRKT